MRRLMERQRRALASHDAGFTLVELIVAMMIIATVLLLLMVVQTSALVTTSQARQRQQATAVANQTLEELRALPWTVLSNGLNLGYVNSHDDPNIPIGTILHPSANLSINENLKTSSTQAGVAPLASGSNNTNKIIQTDPSIPGMTFEARSYTSVSNSANTPGNVIMLTVIVTWKRVGDAKVRTVIARSAAYAPDGACGSLTRANQPFVGACEAIVSSAGGTQGPSITVNGAPVGPPVAGSVPILPGTTALTAKLLSGQADGSTSSQQSVTVDSGATTPGGFLNDASDTPLTTVGLLKILNQASNDLGTTGAAPAAPSDATGTGTATPFQVSSGNFTLRMSSTSGTTGTAKSSLATTICRAGIPAGQGCARGIFNGGTGSATGAFVIASPAATFTLASIPVLTGTNEGWAGRFVTAAGTDASVGCATAVSGAGCASGGAARTLPQIDVGAGPWITVGTGIVQVTGYYDTLMVQRGTSQPPATTLPTVRRGGQIKYWTGSGYSALTLNEFTSTTLTAIPVLTWTGGGYTVTAATTVSITLPATTTTGTDPLCKADSCSINADTGSVTITVTYTVSGAASFAFVAVTSLGTTRASAAFKAAPSA